MEFTLADLPISSSHDAGFKKLEDLMNVQGIGEKNFLKLKSKLSVTPPVKH